MYAMTSSRVRILQQFVDVSFCDTCVSSQCTLVNNEQQYEPTHYMHSNHVGCPSQVLIQPMGHSALNTGQLSPHMVKVHGQYLIEPEAVLTSLVQALLVIKNVLKEVTPAVACACGALSSCMCLWDWSACTGELCLYLSHKQL